MHFEPFFAAARTGAAFLVASLLVASLLAGAVGPAHATDTLSYDLVTLDLTGPSSVDDGQGLCPSAVTVDGIGISYTCYQSYGNAIEQGAWNGKSLLLQGPWKAKCADGVERGIGGGSVSMAVGAGNASAMVAVTGRTCAGRNYIELRRSTAPYGDGTHYFMQAY